MTRTLRSVMARSAIWLSAGAVATAAGLFAATVAGRGHASVPQARVARIAAVATTVACNTPILTSVTLTADISCPGTGLIVAGKGITLNLGGHTVRGGSVAGPYDGIIVVGTGDKVENGIVMDFGRYGVRVGGGESFVSGVVLTKLQVMDNLSDGIVDDGSDTSITGSSAIANLGTGIHDEASSGGSYVGNHLLNNGVDGIYLANGHGVTVKSNIANGNDRGIWDVNSPASVLTANTADFNKSFGLFVQPPITDGGGNTAKGNGYVSGATPVQCFGIVCS